MKNIWKFIGRIAYYVTLPLLYIQLRRTKRTRVFVKYGNEILVVKGWLSRGDWSFPGGGLKRGESPLNCAVRELREETQIEVKSEHLVKLFEEQTKNPHGLTYYCIAYGVELTEKPAVSAQSGELTDIKWINIDELLVMPDSGRLLKPALAAWGKDR